MKLPNKVCQQCGKQFYQPPCFARVRFCSYRCYWDSRIGMPFSDQWRKNISEGVKKHLPSTAIKKGQRLSPKTEFKKGEHLEEAHPHWNGGNGTYVEIYKRNHSKFECEDCGNKKIIEVHHIDGNRKNNKLNNLIALCRECHGKKHRKIEWKKTCEWCKKEFNIGKQEQRFCSISCGLRHSHQVRKDKNANT